MFCLNRTSYIKLFFFLNYMAFKFFLSKTNIVMFYDFLHKSRLSNAYSLLFYGFQYKRNYKYRNNRDENCFYQRLVLIFFTVLVYKCQTAFYRVKKVQINNEHYHHLKTCQLIENSNTNFCKTWHLKLRYNKTRFKLVWKGYLRQNVHNMLELLV